ncbi:hypothetical protein [Arthrobacter sp. 162MFSha1.1]|uniref:hypothetical protein n=1 Tax=Arthrobacter sp. 162MFSha1.1 TaxID=1151119 RepID=UPI0012DBD66A|nr:hypothetical protein [Arthrobacter sp. 162MFSha1.1]
MKDASGFTAEDKRIVDAHDRLIREALESGDCTAADALLQDHGWSEEYALAVHDHFYPYSRARVDAAMEVMALLKAVDPKSEDDMDIFRVKLAESGLTLVQVRECHKQYLDEVRAGTRVHVEFS